MHPAFAKAFALAEAFKAIQPTLSHEQTENADRAIRAEMTKQGFPQKV
jgi:hypothetical protein